MIDLNEASIGDCIYALLSIQSAPVFSEIVKVLVDQGAVEVHTDMWGRRVVLAQNAYWKEKDAKKGKLFKIEHNYKKWAQEYLNDEETETNNRIDTIHNGEPEECENQREDLRDSSIQTSSKRKQKVVRKSSAKERKTKRNRKARRKKE